MNKVDLKLYDSLVKDLAIEKEELKARKEKFDIDNEVLTKRISELNGEISLKKSDITTSALSEYANDPEMKKKLLGGIAIKEKTIISYDEKEALAWALKTGTCLLLDKKTFEKVGPTMVDFIMVGKIPSVTFPKEIKLEELKDES